MRNQARCAQAWVCVLVLEAAASGAPGPRGLNATVVGGHQDCNDEHESCPARAGTLYLPEFLGVHDGYLHISNHEGGLIKRVKLGPSPTIEDYLPWQSYFDWDAQGNLWSLHDFRILRVSPSGDIDVCAGTGQWEPEPADGPALLTGVFWGGGIAVGPDGNVYFAHGEAVRVLEGCGDTGTVRTVAGAIGRWGNGGEGGPSRDAELGWVAMLSFDREGNLYIADEGFGRVLRIDPVDGDYGAGMVTAVARDLWGPRISFDGAGDRLLISDYVNGPILAYDPDRKLVSTLDLRVVEPDGSPAPPDNMTHASHVVADDDGNLYVADDGNAAVYRCDLDGDCVRFAGHGSALPGPIDANTLESMKAIACDESSGVCYLAYNFDRLFRLDPDGTLTMMSAAAKQFAVPSPDGSPVGETTFAQIMTLAVDQRSGDLYVAERFAIRKVDARTGIVTTIVGGPDVGIPEEGAPAVGQPIGWVDYLYVDDGVLYFDSLVFDDLIGLVNARFYTVEHGRIRTLVGGDGHYGFCADGALARDTCLAWPWDIEKNQLTGDLFFTDADNHLVRRIDARDGRVYTVAGDGYGMQGWGRFAGDGGPAIEASFFFPGGLAFDEAGNLFIRDVENQVVRKVEPIGAATVRATGTTRTARSRR
jgi:sugar lactone lactonase YvrE